MSDLREKIARTLRTAHKPRRGYTYPYPYEHPLSSRHVYEAMADALLRSLSQEEANG